MWVVRRCPQPTHGHYDTEESTDDFVHHQLQLSITCLPAVKRPVCVVLLHPQTEEIRFGDYEIEVLVEQLSDVFARSGRYCVGRELF